MVVGGLLLLLVLLGLLALPFRKAPAAADVYKYAGQDPKDAAKNMTVPDGFSVKLFAGEPDVHQPIAMCTDDRGRLWVVEAYTYPKRNPAKGPMLPEKDRKLGDKILIFEDTDGDGTFDKSTTFIEGLNLVSGIEYGFGGVWVGAAPYCAARRGLKYSPPFSSTSSTLRISLAWPPSSR